MYKGSQDQDQDGLIECCEKELVGRAAKLVAGGGVSLGWTGRSAVGWVATIRNRERGRKWAEQEEIDKGGGGGTGARAVILPLCFPVRHMHI